MAQSVAMIELQGLTKRYGSVVAVNNLSFSVRPGVVTGFLGPNGAGKSTTMRMILGLDTPSSGQALISGKKYTQLRSPLTQVGALLDPKWVHPNRSARAHLTWLAASSGIAKSRVDTVLEQVGLSEVARRKAGTYSLGMSQRLGIATTLLGNPEVLLFDEPVNGLDPEGIVWIRKFMKALAREGRTVLVSSHLLSEMALTAEDLVVIGRGKLLWNSTVEGFIAHAAEEVVRVRGPELKAIGEALSTAGLSIEYVNEDVAGSNQQRSVLLVHQSTTDQVGDIAASLGLALHELASKTGSLEEAFMKMTSDAVEYRTDGAGIGGVA